MADNGAPLVGYKKVFGVAAVQEDLMRRNLAHNADAVAGWFKTVRWNGEATAMTVKEVNLHIRVHGRMLSNPLVPARLDLAESRFGRRHAAGQKRGARGGTRMVAGEHRHGSRSSMISSMLLHRPVWIASRKLNRKLLMASCIHSFTSVVIPPPATIAMTFVKYVTLATPAWHSFSFRNA